jgi:hypothetical protein
MRPSLRATIASEEALRDRAFAVQARRVTLTTA